MKKYLFGFLALILLSGCGFLEEDAPVDGRSSDEGSSESDTTEDELTYDGEDPTGGKGNVFGEIRWNGTGAPDLEVLLCADFSSFSGCGGEEFLTTTDAEGQYLFEDVEPGIYALSVRVFDSDDWLYISSGILSSADFEVEAGETLVIGRQNIFKLDLNPTTPGNGGKVTDLELPLEWEAYPDADYYKVSLYPEEGDAILVDKRVDEATITVDLLPVNCGYRWSVEAFNSDRIKIAETAEQFDFVVAGQDGSCVLLIEEPADGAEIRGDGIVLDWEDSPQATSYKILMWNDDDPDRTNVLDFEEVNESSYRFEQTLEPARYVWSVSAYNASGDKVGGTDIFDFTVRP
ncbi:MAG: lipoprotein [Ardenticatenaceae bacterium]|nr:lipoprotein [Ardenticatenaceae bacterium]